MALVSRTPGSTGSRAGASSSSASKDYDPSRKWGLRPSNAAISSAATKTSATMGAGTTYVMPGMVISSVRDKAVGDVMGRERAEKSKREAEKKVLEKLLDNGGADERSLGAARAVLIARDAIAAQRTDAKGKGKAKEESTSSSALAVALDAEKRASRQHGSAKAAAGTRPQTAGETSRRVSCLVFFSVIAFLLSIAPTCVTGGDDAISSDGED